MGSNDNGESAKNTKLLGQTAMHQILHAKCTDKSESEMTELALKIEANMRRFDKTQKGKLTVDDIYNVVKVQNGVDCTKNDIRKLAAELEMDKSYKINIKDFMTVPIISEEVFNSMDRNKDGFVSKGELKLAQQKVSMKELASVIDSLDADHDGKLTMEELKTALKKTQNESPEPKVKSKTKKTGKPGTGNGDSSKSQKNTKNKKSISAK